LIKQPTAAVAPILLALCLILGGSTQGIWAVASLQIMAIVVIAYAALRYSNADVPRSVRQLLWLAAAAIGLAVIQLIPLPPAIWTVLPGREVVIDSREALGLSLGWS
jgi:hypothetical protein